LLLNPQSPTVQVTELSSGAYEFEVQVTDANGASAAARLLVEVSGALPEVNAGPDRYLAGQCH
jgi:hypothetical protein